MNAKKVLSKIVEFLSSTNEVELTYAKLADGTIVESPTFDVGEKLEVVSEDGTKTPAPNGTHELSLKDTEGNETLIKVKTEDGVIVERENVELAAEDASTEKVKDIPEAGTYTKDDEVADPAGSEIKGTFKGAEETEEVDVLPEDATKEDAGEEIELGKKIEEMAYRIEEMAARLAKCEAAMMPAPDEKVAEEVEEQMSKEEQEEEELPKLDGAPIDETGLKFSTNETNRKNYGKKETNSQSSFLSKLYK